MLSGTGSYLGTEVDGKWYKRYGAEGFFARGSGQWWFEEGAFCFRRKLLKTPLRIEFSSVTGIRTGAWHAGKWVMREAVVKVDWDNGGHAMSSGFVFSRTHEGTRQMAAHLEALASRA